jgi:hypothetical protein
MTEHEVDTAGSAASRLFDLRTVIAVLFAIYGVIVTIMGFTSTTDEDIRRAGDINLNLWSGLGMLALAAAFAAWAFLRPLKLPTPEEIEAAPDPGPPAH